MGPPLETSGRVYSVWDANTPAERQEGAEERWPTDTVSEIQQSEDTHTHTERETHTHTHTPHHPPHTLTAPRSPLRESLTHVNLAGVYAHTHTHTHTPSHSHSHSSQTRQHM